MSETEGDVTITIRLAEWLRVDAEVKAARRRMRDGRLGLSAPANARLIAAAPELLAACKAQHEALDQLFSWLIQTRKEFRPSESGQPWDALLAGNDAIAKAEG